MFQTYRVVGCKILKTFGPMGIKFYFEIISLIFEGFSKSNSKFLEEFFPSDSWALETLLAQNNNKFYNGKCVFVKDFYHLKT